MIAVQFSCNFSYFLNKLLYNLLSVPVSKTLTYLTCLKFNIQMHLLIPLSSVGTISSHYDVIAISENCDLRHNTDLQVLHFMFLKYTNSTL